MDKLNLVDILDMANESYPDGWLREYYNSEGKYVAGKGDTLAEFVVKEIIETYDDSSSNQRKVIRAAKAMSTAACELSSIVNHFLVQSRKYE